MYNKLILPNGVRIVSDSIDNVCSAAIGIWVNCGSRFEKAEENGAAHFIEHMLFKGTSSYTAAELAEAMDGIGGQINACTARESTCFYARVLNSHFDTAIDILSDMFFESMFRENDFQSELGVILGEIGMYNDAPEDLVVERLLRKAFPGALGRPMLGTAKSLAKQSGASLKKFKTNKYLGGNTVIALSGNFDDSHIAKIEERFLELEANKSVPTQKGKYVQSYTSKRKATEQEHICIGFPGITASSEDRFALNILSTMLGGGMSSRLFQSVRERSGLCYSIDTFGEAFSDTGMFGVETAVAKETAEAALRLIVKEIIKFRDEGFAASELNRAREQAKSSLVIAQESTLARMNRLGFSELTTGSYLSADELIERCDCITENDIRRLAEKILNFKFSSFSSVGRAGWIEAYQRILIETGE